MYITLCTLCMAEDQGNIDFVKVMTAISTLVYSTRPREWKMGSTGRMQYEEISPATPAIRRSFKIWKSKQRPDASLKNYRSAQPAIPASNADEIFLCIMRYKVPLWNLLVLMRAVSHIETLHTMQLLFKVLQANPVHTGRGNEAQGNLVCDWYERPEVLW